MHGRTEKSTGPCLVKMAEETAEETETHPLGPGGLAQDVFAEGVNPIWLKNLKRSPGIDEFKRTYAKEQTIRTQGASKVHQVVLRDSTSASGAPSSCKSYERNYERSLEMWALEIAVHLTLSWHPHTHIS